MTDAVALTGESLPLSKAPWTVGVRVTVFGLAFALLVGCHPETDYAETAAPGKWSLVELDGAPVPGSRIDLRLTDFDEEELSFTGFRIGIRCDDDGLWNASEGVYVSGARIRLKRPLPVNAFQKTRRGKML